MEDLELRQNFLSVDKKIARDSYGTFFKVGETVGHEGTEGNETAVITSFEIDEESKEIKVFTTRGHCHLDFIYHPGEEELNG